MVKIKFIVITLFIIQSTYAQHYKYGFLVEFTDKNNSVYSVEHPEEFLSERAIQRRIKSNIKVTEQDFPVNVFYTDSIIKNGGVLHVTSRWFNSAVFYADTMLFKTEVENYSFVKSVTLIYRDDIKKSSSISKFDNDEITDNYGKSENQITMCNAQILHKKGYTGKGIQIAVLDAGFWKVNELSCFDTINTNNSILQHWDFVNHNDNIFDDHTHGMAVMSIIAGNLPGELMGTAPGASFYLYVTEDVNSEFPIEEENWIAGAERADSAGADIITASLGYSSYDDVNMSHTYSDMDGKTTRITRGAEIAFSKGMVVVNSAGNEGNKAWYYLTAPSDGENVLCIGAVNADRSITYFSSRGPSFDGRIKPDIVAQGGNTTIINPDGSVGQGSGTSFSCPVITGMTACLWQALPNYNNIQITQLMRSIGDRFYSPDFTYGYGIPDFSNPKIRYILDSIEFSNTTQTEIVKIFPVPVKESVTVGFNINSVQDVSICIYNSQGMKVYSSDKVNFVNTGYNELTIDGFYNMHHGVYILKISTNLEVSTSKFIVE